MTPGFWTYFIKSLLLPPGSLLVLLLLGIAIRRSFIGRFFIFTSVVSLYLLSIPVTTHFLAQELETYPPVKAETLRSEGIQALVVLGGGRYELAPELGGKDTLSRHSVERLSYAVLLQKETGLPMIYTAGKAGADGPPGAELAAEYLKSRFGLQFLAVEDASNNTRQHGIHLVPLLTSLGIQKVAVVTHASHMPRAMLSFRQAGIDAVAAPTGYISMHRSFKPRDWLPDTAALSDSRALLHEYLGLTWYQFTQ